MDDMPTRLPDQQPDTFEAKTRPGIFLYPHPQQSGRWSGDYWVADLEPFKENPNAEPKHVRIHRIKEVIPINRLEPLQFPLAEYRMKCRKIVDENVDFSPTAGSIAEPSEEPAERTERLDTRGVGGVTSSGRVVRKYAGSTRPPDIDPDVWRSFYTPSDKKKAIQEYLEKIRAPPGDPAPSTPAIPITDFDYADIVPEIVPMRMLIVSQRKSGGDPFAKELNQHDAQSIKVYNSGDSEI